jgi:hypothetical protein
LRGLFKSKTADLQPILIREVVVGKEDGELMSFLAFFQHAHEQHLFNFLVGQHQFEMAHAAMPAARLLLHAVQVVVPPAVGA